MMGSGEEREGEREVTESGERRGYMYIIYVHVCGDGGSVQG